MATTVANLVAKLNADTSGFSKGLKSAEKETAGLASKTQKSFAKLGPAVAAGAAVAGAAIVGVATKSVLAFADFEKGMKEVYTLMPGISEKAMKEMEGDVKSLSKEMGVLPDDVVPALYQSLSAGVPPDNVLSFMETAAKAAVGGGVELETAVDGITSAVNAYGADVLSAEAASDIMFTTVRLGKTDMGELSGALFQVAPIAAGLGVNFGEVSAALAALTAQGVPTSVAATQIKGALAELGKEGSIAFQHFTDATGQTFPAFIEGGGTVEEAFLAMKGKADDMNTGVGNLFGSIEAGQAVLALTGESGAPAFKTAMEEMQGSAGATEEAFNTMDEGLSRTWDKIKANLQVALLDMGEKLAPFVQQFADWFLEVLPGAIDWTIAAVEKLVGWFGDFIAGGKAVVEWFKKLPGFTDKAVLGIGAVGIALMALYANPVIAGLALVAGAVIAIGQHAQDAEDRVHDLEAAITGTAQIDLSEMVTGGQETIDIILGLGFSMDDLEAAVMGTQGEWDIFWKSAKDKSGGSLLDMDPAIEKLNHLRQELNTTERKMSDTWTGGRKAMGDWAADVDSDTDDAVRSFERIPLTVEEAMAIDDLEAFQEGLGAWNTAIDYGTTDAETDLQEFMAATGSTLAEAEAALGINQEAFGTWASVLGEEGAAMEQSVTQSVQGMITMFAGAPEQVQISVDQMVQNLMDTANAAKDYERVMNELMDAGFYGLARSLAEQGPTFTSAFEGMLTDAANGGEAAFQANLYLTGIIIEAITNGAISASQHASEVGSLLARAVEAGFNPYLPSPTVGIAATPPPAPSFTPTVPWVPPKITGAQGLVAIGPTTALIGEGGEPEAVIPLSKWSDMTGGSGGGGMTVIVEGNLFGAATTDELVEVLEDARREYRLRGGAMA